MKRIILVSAGIIAMFSAVTPALADNVIGASATGTAAVTILTPIAVKQTQGLDFGSITSGERGGEVVIDPSDGVRSVEGGVGAVAANIGQAGTFAVTGEPNAAIDPREQLYPQISFKRMYSARQRWLGLMQQFRRMRYASQFGDLDEGSKADDVHCHTLFACFGYQYSICRY